MVSSSFSGAGDARFRTPAPTLDKMVGSREEGQYVFVNGQAEPLVVRSRILATPTLTVPGTAAVLYTSGDAVGLLFPIEGLIRENGGGCIIESVTVIDNHAGTGFNLDIYLFTKKPTQVADNAAFALTDTDAAFCVGVIPITEHHASDTANAISQARAVGLAVRANPETAILWAQCVTRGGPTYAAGGLSVRFTAIAA